MARTARVEPISREQKDAIIVSGWRVVDVTELDAPQEISQHEIEPQAIEAARRFEAETSHEHGSAPDDTQDYDASDPNAGKHTSLKIISAPRSSIIWCPVRQGSLPCVAKNWLSIATIRVIYRFSRRFART